MLPDELKDDFELVENFLLEDFSFNLLEKLKNNTKWEQREIKIFNKIYLQPRLIKWYGDFDYKYSNQLFKKDSFPDFLLDLKERIQKYSNSKFNSVLINYYRDGNDSMGKHQDNEKELGINPVIASISLGECRRFIVENILTKKKFNIILNNGSLLIMKNYSQKLYYHSLPKSSKIKKERINLTFRYIEV